MSEWIVKTIGELCDLGNGKVQTGPFGSQLHQSDYQAEGYPFVMPKDILNGRIDESSIARVSINHVERLSKHRLSFGDIIYGRRGDIGRQALVRQENVGWLCGSGCLRISLGDAPIDPKFLHLYLKLPEVMAWVENQAIGATMPNLNTKILRSVPIRYPSNINQQQQIVAIVSAYDDLIENNDRRIALLEKMTEEIYREWFVRLRFPGWEAIEFHKGVPDGWQVKRLDEFCKRVTDGTHETPKPTDDGYFLVTGKNLKNGTVNFESAYKISKQDHLNISKRSGLEVGDIIFSNIGTLGSMAIFTGDIDYSVKNVLIFKLFNESQSIFLYCMLKEGYVLDQLLAYCSGASQQFISLQVARRFQIFDPGMLLINEFGKLVLPLHKQKIFLGKANEKLRQTRDRLLTRLISGKLSVEDLDIQFHPSMTADP